MLHGQGNAPSPPPAYGVVTNVNSVQLHAGIFQRTIALAHGQVSSSVLSIDGHNCLLGPAGEVAFTISCAQPNQCPRGLKPDGAAIETTAHFSPGTDSLRVEGARPKENPGVAWVQEVSLRASSWSAQFEPATSRIGPVAGGRRLTLTAPAQPASPLKGLTVSFCYEVYDGYPVIRKWVEFSNRGSRWLKLSNLVIDDLELAPEYRRQVPLTPGERGAGPSVTAFETPDEQRGVIAVSEIPSALRQTRETGAMGYASEYFEWVLGPGEQFASEPVFLLAYCGEVKQTISALSTPRDRAVERIYLDFLRRHVGIAADQTSPAAPQWCSWSNFGWNLNENVVREQARLAARCGFELVLLDSGWQKDLIGTEPDPRKFPEFTATCAYVRSLGLKLGLWVSCFRSADSPDLRQAPELRSVPLIKRDGGFGMSFASPWRHAYAQDLARLSRDCGVSYFKQDYTNIKFGDAAEGHESRTRPESLLRGLRGLLEAQDLLRKAAPGVISELTHEIYWGTPGVPCDIAVLKHAATYHIPPNDYAGVGHSKQRVSANWSYDPAQLRQQLLAGCFHARQRFYAHRGLPLYALEYYAAHAVNVRGSLTPALQERQVCSWLMGVPATFAGDLASLSEENLQCYRRLFALLARLEKTYGIYRHFQFSGVPGPTDSDWHWWGKLNPDGAGAVIVLRGSGGDAQRAVNIPWVSPERTYDVTSLLAGKSLGRFNGKQLQAGALVQALPPFGQEIFELQPVR